MKSCLLGNTAEDLAGEEKSLIELMILFCPTSATKFRGEGSNCNKNSNPFVQKSTQPCDEHKAHYSFAFY